MVRGTALDLCQSSLAVLTAQCSPFALSGGPCHANSRGMARHRATCIYSQAAWRPGSCAWQPADTALLTCWPPGCTIRLCDCVDGRVRVHASWPYVGSRERFAAGGPLHRTALWLHCSSSMPFARRSHSVVGLATVYVLCSCHGSRHSLPRTLHASRSLALRSPLPSPTVETVKPRNALAVTIGLLLNCPPAGRGPCLRCRRVTSGPPWFASSKLPQTRRLQTDWTTFSHDVCALPCLRGNGEAAARRG